MSRARAVPLLLALVAPGCAGSPPTTLGVRNGALADCPPTPNCVHSADPAAERRVPPFHLRVDASAWARVRQVVEEMPRTRVVTSTDTYLHAQATTLVLRFVDDLELLLKPDEGRIVVRSASRLGRSDLGVNRRRVERLRGDLREAGLVR